MPVGIPHPREPGPPWKIELLQERDLGRIVVRHAGSDEPLQMLQEMPAEDVAGAIRARNRIGAHHVVEIRVGIGLVLPVADARHRTRRRAPDVVAQCEEHSLEPRVLRLGSRAWLPQVE